MKVFIFLVSFFIFSTFSWAQIVIAYDTSSIGDPNKASEPQQIEIDKIKQIAIKNKLDVAFKAIPWNRALLMIEKGKVDGLIQASYKQSRALYANYPMKNDEVDSSKKLNDGNSYYIYRNVNSNLIWDGKKFLNNGVVAAMEKYAVIDDLKKHPNIRIETFRNNNQIIRKVASGQIDAYAGSSRITDRTLKDFPSLAKNIVRESLPIRKKDYFLIFSKITYKQKSKQMNIIWNGLKEFNEKK